MPTPIRYGAEGSRGGQPPSRPRFELKSLVGRGASGKVYRAYDHTLGRCVALKILDNDASNAARRSFDRERNALARLQHPNIVTLFDSRPHGTQPFLAMSFHSGPTLQEILANHKLDEGQTLSVGYELARVLAHIHARGILYRDLKPENVILDGSSLVLIDFGTAIELRHEKRRGEVCGTPGFMAPEVYDGAYSDERCDVFSLGATLYECVAGDTPYAVFAKRRPQIRAHRYVHPSEANASLSRAFADFIHNCLILEPTQRLASAEDALAMMKPLLRFHGIYDSREVLRETVLQCTGRLATTLTR